MAFERPITIAEAIQNIETREYFLPAIQREFVWTRTQIEILFDSILRDYPIGSFLFWRVNPDSIRNYQFYEFIRNFHERDNRHNPKASPSDRSAVTAILDGQQRLTALYIGLKGTHCAKQKYKRKKSADAYSRTRLFLNLVSKSKRVDREFDFRFLTEDEAKIESETELWFPISEVMRFKSPSDVNDYLIRREIFTNYPGDYGRHANEVLYLLFTKVNITPAIHYFREPSEELDKVLNIFIRVNSGGTQLSYSDLLLSIATAQWQQRDAREEINACVDDLNRKGGGFKFDKEFVLKSCLVLCDVSDVGFKVDNFNRRNMEKIEAEWPKIKTAVLAALDAVIGFGFSDQTLASKYALIPIAYYIFIKDLAKNFNDSPGYKQDRMAIRQWLLQSLLKRAFSGQPDGVLSRVRQVLRESHDGFPFDALVEKFRGHSKSIVVSSDDIDASMALRYGRAHTFVALSLIYSSLDFRNQFHVDHVHPRSLFRSSRLAEYGVPRGKWKEARDCCDLLPNLQLLEGPENMAKSDMLFEEWVGRNYPRSEERQDYFRRHHIPDTKLSVGAFFRFYDAREELMREALTKALEPEWV